METRDYANWLQQEHQRAAELAAVLREKVGCIPQGGFEQWLAELRDRFDHLRAHLQKHMALEERGGYLTAVLEQRPTLSGAVELLRNEHRELTRIMNGIHQTLHEVAPQDTLMIRDSCVRIQNLLSYVEHHEARENSLVLSVFTEDLGAGG